MHLPPASYCIKTSRLCGSGVAAHCSATEISASRMLATPVNLAVHTIRQGATGPSQVTS